MLTYLLWCISSTEHINHDIFKYSLKYKYYYYVKFEIASNNILPMSETLNIQWH